MKIKTILCTLCAVTVLGSCSYDDDVHAALFQHNTLIFVGYLSLIHI